jgi:hypothetical protein
MPSEAAWQIAAYCMTKTFCNRHCNPTPIIGRLPPISNGPERRGERGARQEDQKAIGASSCRAVKKANDMAKRKLSDWEKLQARTDYRAKRGRQFSSVDIADVHVEDWTDEYGQPVVTVQNENKP